MKKQEKEIIKEAIKDIERWAGDAYITPDTYKECPDGDEVYQALEKIKEVVGME